MKLYEYISIALMIDGLLGIVLLITLYLKANASFLVLLVTAIMVMMFYVLGYLQEIAGSLQRYSPK